MQITYKHILDPCKPVLSYFASYFYAVDEYMYSMSLDL